MKLTARAAMAGLAWIACALAPSSARASDADPWFGHDKVLHFGASAGIAATGYGAGTLAFDARYEALLLGAGLALAAGVGKEAYDAMGYGDPSWRDFAWDVAGTVTGLGAAWGIDLALRGAGPDHPAWATRGEPLSVSMSWRF